MKAFRCAWTGLLYPADYMKEWGRKYGIGMGSEPRSEALNTRYDMPVCHTENGEMEKAMHPMELVPSGQMDLVEVSAEEYRDKQAILAIDDPRFEKRAKILRGKQLEKPEGKLSALVRQKESV